MNLFDRCPCGSQDTYEKCCAPFHQGIAKPKTPEKLMRSRYCAYVVGKIDYIAATNDPETGQDFDADAAQVWSKESKWLGLEVVAASDNEVEFKASYEVNGVLHIHHEVSLFRFDAHQQKWFYRDGKTIQEPIRRTEPKLGRNDPCHCGSGKKLKKCHG